MKCKLQLVSTWIYCHLSLLAAEWKNGFTVSEKIVPNCMLDWYRFRLINDVLWVDEILINYAGECLKVSLWNWVYFDHVYIAAGVFATGWNEVSCWIIALVDDEHNAWISELIDWLWLLQSSCNSCCKNHVVVCRIHVVVAAKWHSDRDARWLD